MSSLDHLNHCIAVVNSDPKVSNHWAKLINVVLPDLRVVQIKTLHNVYELLRKIDPKYLVHNTGIRIGLMLSEQSMSPMLADGTYDYRSGKLDIFYRLLPRLYTYKPHVIIATWAIDDDLDSHSFWVAVRDINEQESNFVNTFLHHTTNTDENIKKSVEEGFSDWLASTKRKEKILQQLAKFQKG
jgi:hypothetical protein